MNEITTIQNVRGYCDERGTAWLNAEDVARGLGFTQTKNGVEYVRWETVNKYLTDFDFPKKVGKDDFVPENMFYRLVWKSRDEKALAFQSLVADEILPAIRKNGIYLNPNAPIDPRFLRKMADELEARDKQIAALTAQVDELQPKADYAESILRCQDAVPITLIAKDYGYGAASFNELLHTFRIQFKTGGTWALYQPYAKMGYAVTTPEILKNGLTVTHMRWTQKGRMFLYNVLKRENIVPVIERDDHTISLF